MKYLFTITFALLSFFKMDAARLTSAKFIETATTQRMLSQKIQEQIKDDKNKISNTVFEQVFHEMDDAIGFIIASDYNIKADTEELAGLTSLEFDNLKENKEDFINGNLEVDKVYKTTNKLAKLYSNLNYAYSKL